MWWNHIWIPRIRFLGDTQTTSRRWTYSSFVALGSGASNYLSNRWVHLTLGLTTLIGATQKKMDLLEKQHVGFLWSLGCLEFLFFSVQISRSSEVYLWCAWPEQRGAKSYRCSEILSTCAAGSKVEIWVDTCVQFGGEFIVLPCVFYYNVVGPF